MGMTIHRIDENLAAWLQSEAAKRGMTAEEFALDVLRRQAARSQHKDKSAGKVSQQQQLVKLAGTWSDNDAREFEKHTAPFNRIDDELWQ